MELTTIKAKPGKGSGKTKTDRVVIETVDTYTGDPRGIEIAREAADFVSRRLKIVACYAKIEGPQPVPTYPSCASSVPDGTLDIDVPAAEFWTAPASAIVQRFAAALEAMAAELSAAGKPSILTIDLPVPRGMDCAGRAVVGDVALRFVRDHDVVADRYAHRFDVMFSPVSPEFIEWTRKIWAWQSVKQISLPVVSR